MSIVTKIELLSTDRATVERVAPYVNTLSRAGGISLPAYLKKHFDQQVSDTDITINDAILSIDALYYQLRYTIFEWESLWIAVDRYLSLNSGVTKMIINEIISIASDYIVQIRHSRLEEMSLGTKIALLLKRTKPYNLGGLKLRGGLTPHELWNIVNICNRNIYPVYVTNTWGRFVDIGTYPQDIFDSLVRSTVNPTTIVITDLRSHDQFPCSIYIDDAKYLYPAITAATRRIYYEPHRYTDVVIIGSSILMRLACLCSVHHRYKIWDNGQSLPDALGVDFDAPYFYTMEELIC